MPCPGIRVKMVYRKTIAPAPCSEPCKIKPGEIIGCIWGCSCCDSHEFEVKLYKIHNEKKLLVHCEKVGCCGCFKIVAPYDDCYLLVVCPADTKRNSNCKPMLTLKNVGVSSLMIEA